MLDTVASDLSSNLLKRDSSRRSTRSAQQWDGRLCPKHSQDFSRSDIDRYDVVDVYLNGLDHDFIAPGENDVRAEEEAACCCVRCFSSCKRSLNTTSHLPGWSYHRLVARLQNGCSELEKNPNSRPSMTLQRTLTILTTDEEAAEPECPKVPVPITLNYTCGEALKLSTRSSVVLWTGVGFVFVTVFFVGKYKECDSPDIPSWIYAPIGAVILYCCYLEFQALKFAVLPYASQTKKFVVLSVNLRYTQWLAAELLMSALTMLSFFTNAMFFASTMSLVGCGENCPFATNRHKIEALWEKLQMHAIWGILPIWDIISPSIVAGAFFLFVMYQLFDVYVHTVQLPEKHWDDDEEEINYTVCYHVKKDKKGKQFFAEVRWSTWARKWKWTNWRMTFSEAVFKQAGITGWCSFRQMSLSYPLSQLKGIEQRLDGERKFAAQAVRRLKPVVTQAWQSLLFSTFLRTALQLNLQVTLFMLYRALNGESRTGSVVANVANANRTQLVSILLAFGTSLTFEFDLFYTVSRHWLRITNNKHIKDLVHERKPASWERHERTSSNICPYCENWKKDNDPMCNDHWERKAVWEDHEQVRRAFLAMLFLFLVCNLLIFYAIFKLVMSFVCYDALWNYHSWCVNIKSDQMCLSGLNSSNSTFA